MRLNYDGNSRNSNWFPGFDFRAPFWGRLPSVEARSILLPAWLCANPLLGCPSHANDNSPPAERVNSPLIGRLSRSFEASIHALAGGGTAAFAGRIQVRKAVGARLDALYASILKVLAVFSPTAAPLDSYLS